MLTALELENFKGIAARQRIDFAALTLLFGANSAGKSTILQALLYLHELLEHGGADVDRTWLGGSVLELGGFARMVHRHETGRAIVLRVEFATPGSLERFGRDLTDFPFPDLDDEVASAWLELTIAFRTTATFRGPLVERVKIGVGRESEPLVWIETGSSLREGEPLHARVNLGHPLIAENATEITEAWELIAVTEEARKRTPASERRAYGSVPSAQDRPDFGDGRSLPVFALSRSRLSALPPTNEPMRILPWAAVDDLPDELTRARAENAALRANAPKGYPNKSQARDIQELIEAQERAIFQVRTFLEMVVLGTAAQLSAFLSDALYVGPLRTVPPRGFLYERAGRITSWADGLAAWDLLLADRAGLVERTNLWLRRLDAGCQVVVQQLMDSGADAEELSAGHADKTVRRLLLDTGAGSLVLPSEVGAGVSQIIPVLVAALAEGTGLTLVEQPEIHVHPAVQVGLGDLLIDAASRDGARRMLLVETHSEHLILRLLRRIRETTEKELPDGAPAFSEDKLSVVYVEASPQGVRVRRLRVDERGEFKDRWPKGFFEERAEELF